MALGVKYSESVREFALKISYVSSRAYEVLRSTFDNNLPAKSTIRAWYGNSKFHTNCGLIHGVFNYLKIKAEEKKAAGSELICSLTFDEMSTRQHIQWSHSNKMFLGYPTYGKGKKNSKLAKQVIVYMLCGVNEPFHFPVAFHFIKSLDATERATLFKEVVFALQKIGITPMNVTFDGYSANHKMCFELGANLNFNDRRFQPYVCWENEKKTFIIKDPPHMHKLVRNALARNECLIDGDDNEICWKFYEHLVEYCKTNHFSSMHKLNQKHIQWKRNSMKVELAVQTFSQSVADSLSLLNSLGRPEFANVDATIRFTQRFNDLFDVFNTKSDDTDELCIYKRALCPANREKVFDLFEKSIEYIKNLKYIDRNDHNKIKSVLKSKFCVGFKGYITNMRVIMMIYQEYIEDSQLLVNIKVYWIGQDILEVFFGKVRSLNGFNDNPTAQQFIGAIRKLLAFYMILSSKHSNCNEFVRSSSSISNILNVSSTLVRTDESTDQEITPAELEILYQKLFEMEASTNDASQSLQDHTVAHICCEIEERIAYKGRMYCEHCSNVFEENEKLQNIDVCKNYIRKPCSSTFDICKKADRFLNIELILSSTSFNVITEGIYNDQDIENLFTKTDYTHDPNHKLYLIKMIVDVYILLKLTHSAKTATFDAHTELLRSKFRKLIHARGQ